MKNITLSLEDDLLREGREYAKQHGTSLNALIRRILARVVATRQEDWLGETFLLMDKAQGDSKGKKWKRSDLYDV